MSLPSRTRPLFRRWPMRLRYRTCQRFRKHRPSPLRLRLRCLRRARRLCYFWRCTAVRPVRTQPRGQSRVGSEASTSQYTQPRRGVTDFILRAADWSTATHAPSRLLGRDSTTKRAVANTRPATPRRDTCPQTLARLVDVGVRCTNCSRRFRRRSSRGSRSKLRRYRSWRRTRRLFCTLARYSCPRPVRAGSSRARSCRHSEWPRSHQESSLPARPPCRCNRSRRWRNLPSHHKLGLAPCIQRGLRRNGRRRPPLTRDSRSGPERCTLRCRTSVAPDPESEARCHPPPRLLRPRRLRRFPPFLPRWRHRSLRRRHRSCFRMQPVRRPSPNTPKFASASPFPGL